MSWLKRMAAAALLMGAAAAVAGADTWNDKTILKFDTPVMIPGATLAPGTYTFKLLDSAANRHVVQIFSEDGTRLVATANAIPTKRLESTGDVVVKLNPTEAGAPAAIKAWFFPGSLYGHQFVYPEHQARDIAQRTKTLVLSRDVPGSDMQKGTLYTYDAEGKRTAWQADSGVLKEWDDWNRQRAQTSAAKVVAPGSEDTRKSTAPMMRGNPQGMSVALGDLEENPGKYTGKTINVTAEVEDVLGPGLFKIDEAAWGDLDGEILVHVPGLAALVREGDRVTVTGTLKTLVRADLQRELGWLEPDPDVEIEFAARPVLVATRIVGGNSDVALAIRVNPGASAAGAGETAAVGTSGTAAAGREPAVTAVAALGNGGRDMVGRKVDLDGAKVGRTRTNQGFWIEAGDGRVFVLPAEHGSNTTLPKTGESVSIEGVVLEMPEPMREKARGTDGANDDIYVYAARVD